MQFKGHRAIWSWENSSQAEQTEYDVANTLKRYANTDNLFRKVMDGSTFMGNIPNADPGGPKSYQDWWSSAQIYESLGIRAIPWVVPNSPGDAVNHSPLSSTLILDVEPYDGFWANTSNNLNDYLNQLSQVQEVYVSIDARPLAWDAMQVDSWINHPLVKGLIPQLYWGDFTNENPWNCVGYLYRCLVACSSTKVVIPAFRFDSGQSPANDGSPNDLLAFWRIAQAWGCVAPSLWRLGSATIDELMQFGSLPV